MPFLPRNRWARRILLALAALLAAVAILALVRAILLFPEVGLERILAEKTLEQPVYLAEFRDGSGDMAVVEKQGRVLWFRRGATKAAGTLVDLRARVGIRGYEDGLLSIAFHPEFRINGQFFAAFTTRRPLTLTVSRFTVDDSRRHADSASEDVLLAIPKPGPNHNGGMLAFGPDGKLFISVGESQYKKYSQALDSLLGKILRIDPDRPEEGWRYGIPEDNPFAGAADGTRREIWAYGLRNPWRISFDRETGELYAGDVGEEKYEEIDRIEKGKNYGWPMFEGEQCLVSAEECQRGGYERPLAAFPRVVSRAVIGGFVYRGQMLPWLRGRYVFADLFRGLYAIDTDASGVITVPDALLYRPEAEAGDRAGQELRIASLAEDLGGELYLIDLKGSLYRIVPR